MALIDESRAAFRELRELMPATIEFNGITKTGVSQTLTIKRAQDVSNYQVDGSTQFTLEDTDFEALEWEGLKDRVGEVSINGSDPLVITSIDRHPNSAVVHLFLIPSQ